MLSTISSVSFKWDPKSPGCYWVECLVGYQPTLSTEMGWFLTRMTSTKEEGSITSIQAVYVPAGDLTSPAAPACHHICLDATTVLSRGLAAKGIYPAVDPEDSRSTMLQPRIIGEEHYETACAKS